jgi:hypothetical protein
MQRAVDLRYTRYQENQTNLCAGLQLSDDQVSGQKVVAFVRRQAGGADSDVTLNATDIQRLAVVLQDKREIKRNTF